MNVNTVSQSQSSSSSVEPSAKRQKTEESSSDIINKIAREAHPILRVIAEFIPNESCVPFLRTCTSFYRNPNLVAATLDLKGHKKWIVNRTIQNRLYALQSLLRLPRYFKMSE